jgi:ketosteroid isomerase-like protein
MSQENVDLVRSILAANERGDYSSTAWADPEIEFVIADGPSPGGWSGIAGMETGWRDIATAWRDMRTVADQFRELDDERVLVLIHREGYGRVSGFQVGENLTKGASVFHVRSGKVARLVVYFDRDRALADLGLKE